ncbi:MAG: hypothetical protein M1823_000705 [Watsoniomyces obsoletus]|nr:MAG: hypothetical protein M1823_000705 [Watsoniomyces obsoletus]
MIPGQDRSSFTARRSAASNLPSFQLPPPPELPSVQKFASFPGSQHNGTHPGAIHSGSLLTPPSTVSGDEGLGPVASAMAAAHHQASAHSAFTPYTPLGFGGQGALSDSAYELGTRQQQAPPPSMFAGGQQQQPQQQQNPMFPPRGAFSPSLAAMLRGSPGSTPNAERPPPSLDYPQGVYGSSMSYGTNAATTANSGSLPGLGGQLPMAVSPGWNPPPSSALLSPLHAPPHNPFAPRKASTPAYYQVSQPASAPAHQTTFPTSLAAGSPPHQHQHHHQPPSVSPLSSSRLSSMSSESGPFPLLHPSSGGGSVSSTAQLSRSLSFSLPAVAGTYPPHLQHQTNQMSMLGGPLGSAYAAHGALGRAYLGPGQGAMQATTRPNDRPYRCNQCPQSFNRNHDLKRHKQIHLAVKPFPCRHCDKSFSRKDALKRHILVKGCGKTPALETTRVPDDGSLSPPEHSEVMSGDEAADSPGLSNDSNYHPGQ